MLLVVIGLAVLGVSFIIGRQIYSVYKTMVRDASQENVTLQSSKEMPYAAVVPEADKPVEREVEKGVKASAPRTIDDPASSQAEKVGKAVMTPAMEENMAQSANKVAAPLAGAEKPAATARPEGAASSVKPAAGDSAVKPAVRRPKPIVKQKTAALKVPKTLKKYKVIAGSFSMTANADALVSQLKALKYEPIIVLAKTPKGKLYRVIVGSYGSLRETKTKMDELQKLGFKSFYIFE